jgi:hypothetical protein
MKSVVSRSSLFAVTAATLALAGPANAAQTFHFDLSGRSIDAFFFSATDDGCVVATTSFHYGESSVHTPPGGPTTQAIALVEVFYLNSCTGQQFVLDGGTTTQTVKIRGNLTRAEYSAVIPVTDGNITANLNINFVSNASGDLQRVHDVANSRGSGTVFHMDETVEARNAIPTGDLSIVLPLAAGPTTVDLAPGSNQDSGFVASINQGFVDVTM